jgi:hypothetical protein
MEYQSLNRNGASVSAGDPGVKAKEARNATLWRSRDTKKGATAPFFPLCGKGLQAAWETFGGSSASSAR